MCTTVLCAVVVLFSVFSLNGAVGPVVQLPKGKIRGHILQSENGNPYYVFQEIPYAAPPVGTNRFQLPKEPIPWSGILNTTRNTAVCYQRNAKYENLKPNEDCLFINVYSPVQPGTSKRLPVLVWIHGGGYVIESSTYEYYGPKYIMDHGIVVVTFNYRLGAFGFLTTVDDVIPANLGLKDQLFALEWVNQNIELFGGDPTSVTLAGESAGSDAIGRHLLGPWPNNKVLFHAAILQSGSPIYNTKTNNASIEAFRIGRALDQTFLSNKSTELLKVLQKAPADKILEVAQPAPIPIFEETGPFGYHMFDSLVKGDIKKVPVIIGFTSEEAIGAGSEPDVKEKAAVLDKDPSQLLERQLYLSKEDRIAAGNLLRKIYTNTSFEDNIGAYVRYVSDKYMSWSILKQADLESKYADVYLYQFSYKGQLGGMTNIPDIPGADNVGHTEDLRYFWDDQTNTDLSKFPAQDRLMLHRFVKLWTNFVKYHNPTPKKDRLLEDVIWMPVDPNKTDDIRYLNMNVTLDMQKNPRYHRQIKNVLDYYITPGVIE